MKNFGAPGDSIQVTAPYAVVPGDGMLIGALFCVAAKTAASGVLTDAVTEGQFDLTAVNAETAGEGAVAYWDAANRRVSVSEGVPIGAFPGGKAAGQAVARVRLQTAAGQAVARPISVTASQTTAAACVSTATDEVLATGVFAVPDIGIRSQVDFQPNWKFTNSANNKILRLKLNGTTVWERTRTTTDAEAPLIRMVMAGALNAQTWPFANGAATAGVAGFTSAGAMAEFTTAIDFSAPVTWQLCGQRANSGDTLRLVSALVVHYPGA